MKKSFVDTIGIFVFVTTGTVTEGFVVPYYYYNESPMPTRSRSSSPSHHHHHQRPIITNSIVHQNNNNDFGSNIIGRRKIQMRLGAKSRKSPGGGAPMELPASNEFSRTLHADRILKTRKSTTGISNSFYPVSIEANDLECVALARRFDLSSIANLSASLQLRPSSLTTGGISSNSIEVEGMCKSIVTQRCVRTNEDFEVAVEFPIYCIVRPVLPSNNNNNGIVSPLDVPPPIAGSYHDTGSSGRNGDRSSPPQQAHRKASGTNANKKSYRLPDRNIDEMDVMELQRLLQADINADDDTLMEDEAIYSLQDGNIDVGELVAQLFWFKLDPYPKKPGTDPIQRSITG